MLISIPRHCVRNLFCWGGFPLARPLPSIPSAAGRPALFGDFAGTTGLSDFPCPFIIGVCPWTSRHDPQHHLLRVDTGPPGSRARCFRTCTGSLTARGPCPSRVGDGPDVAFRIPPQRRHPEGLPEGRGFFRGSIPGLHVPLSTLRLYPRGQRRMTRGRCGPLTLQRMTLSFTTPRRFIPAHGGSRMTSTRPRHVLVRRRRSRPPLGDTSSAGFPQTLFLGLLSPHRLRSPA